MNDGSEVVPAAGGTAFFTICSNNYMPFAKVLLESVRRHHPDAALFGSCSTRVRSGLAA